jgi:FkbM family methyltransferase
MNKFFELRGVKTQIDVDFENEIGVYGDIFWAMIENNLYEPETFDFIKKSFMPESTFIDVGAATGCMTIYAAHLGYQVISIEPQTKVFEALKRNLNLNPEVSIKVHALHALVVDSNQEEITKLNKFFSHGAAGPLEALEKNVGLVDLQTVISKTKSGTPISIKMDIEGVEFNILRNKDLLALLKTREANMYLSLHPGFLRPLQSNNFVKKFIWRVRAIREVDNLFTRLSKYGQVYNSTKLIRLNRASILFELRRNSRDFHISFG